MIETMNPHWNDLSKAWDGDPSATPQDDRIIA
jgi:hypothetical protein